MPNELSRRALLVQGASMLAGCSAHLGGFPFDAGSTTPGPLGIDLTFYSVACARIRFGGVDVLTDPFWSHLPLHQVALGKTLPDPAQVDPYLSQLDQVQAVIVGHNHYDHNLDLPYVAGSLHPDAQILGSATLVHTFTPNQLPRPLVDLSANVATHDRDGRWWTHPGKRLRVLPILSGHPNQIGFIHLYTKQVHQDRTRIPTRAHHYQEGMTLAFLVDYLHADGGIARRIYVQTSSTGHPAGFFPENIRDEHPIDAALLPMDCANLAMAGKPTIIDYLSPPVVMFCHWEDFFRPKSEEPREIVKVNLPAARAFFQNTPDRTYLFPHWDSTHRL